MDLKDKRSLDEQVEEIEDFKGSLNEKKCCTDCHTTRTPLWRGGPSGPKSLCNACGIKYNKKRRQQITGSYDKNRTKASKNTYQNRDLKLKMKLMVVNQNKQQQQQPHNHDLHKQKLQRKRSSYKRGKPWWNKLREEEQAAILLMAISCGGSLYS